MEAVIQATGECAACGQFKVDMTSVTIRQRSDDNSWAYRVRCPACRLLLLEPLTATIANHCLDAGAHFEVWSMPPALESHTETGSLSLNDLDGLRIDLERHDLVEGLRASLHL